MLQNTDILSVVSHLEKSEPKRQEGSFFHSLLFGDTLSLALVLVTSRASVSAPLHREACISQFIEVHGFNKQSIRNYVIQSEIQKGDRHMIFEQLDHNPLRGGYRGRAKGAVAPPPISPNIGLF